MNYRATLYSLALIFSLTSAFAMEKGDDGVGRKRPNSHPNQGLEYASKTKGQKTIKAEPVRAAKKAIIPPNPYITPTLGGCLKFYANYLSFHDLVRLAHVSKDARGGLYRTSPNPWENRVIKVYLGAKSLESLVTCRYPFSNNAVEIVFELRNSRQLLKNLNYLFSWIKRSPPPELTFNFNYSPGFDGLPNTHDGWAEHHSSLYSTFGSVLFTRQDEIPCIRKVGFSNFIFPDDKENDFSFLPDSFLQGLGSILSPVTELTVTNCSLVTESEWGNHNVDTTLSPKLESLEVLTVLSSPNNPSDPIWPRGLDMYMKTTLRSITLKGLEVGMWDENPNPFTRFGNLKNLQTLILENVRFYMFNNDWFTHTFTQEQLMDFSILLAGLPELQTLIIKGGAWALDEDKDDLQDYFHQTLPHLTTLQLDW